jgi:hypothetical protein
MPVKTKKKPTTSRPRSTVTKSNKVLSSKVNKKRVLIVIAVLAVIGAFLMFRASAAVSNFEAEINSQVPVFSDATASDGKYAQFNTASSQPVTSVERFPGDPNPKVSGKAYWGANVTALLADGSKTSDVYTRHEKGGKSLSLYHRYYQWSALDGTSSSIINNVKTDQAANRLPYVTFKTADDWAAVGNGTYDAKIDAFLKNLDTVGKPVWITAWHEPENDTNGTTRTAASYRSMQSRIRARMKAVGTKNIAFMPHLMDSTTRNNGTRNPADWWVDGIWDVVMFSNYCQRSCVDKGGNTYDTDARTQSIKYIESKGLPWGVGEWSLSEERTGALRFTQYFKPYWEWAFINKSDGVAYSYFDADESRPDSSSPYYASLRDANLDAFHDILWNDQRVKRINDPVASTASVLPVTYGMIKSDVTLPESGAYKLWVRMKAADVTNNSVNVQIDNGTVVKLGGSNVSTTDWTWVDMPAVNLNSGTRTVTLTGTQKGVKVDRVIITTESCIPSGTGDLCAIATPPPPVAPAVTVSGITEGQSISGTVKVSVTSKSNIESVAFRPDDVWNETDTTAPYEYNWDTTKYPNGTHSIVTRTRAVGDPGDVYTQNTVTVNIQNKSAVTTPPPAPVDTTAPTKPTNLRANLNFDWTKMNYVMNLTWSASYDNVGVSSYQITRNNTKLGTTSITSFNDAKNLSSGTLYTYKVAASDAKGNTSSAATISLKTNCVLLSCTATVQ